MRAAHSSTPCRSEEHTSELQSHLNIVCRLLLEKKKTLLDSPVRTERLTSPIGAGHNDLSGFVGQNIRSKVMSGTGHFFLIDTPAPRSYTLSLHDALPI